MSVNVDVFLLDKERIKDKTLELYDNKIDEEKLLKVLKYFTTEMKHKYILLNNEHWEEVNPYYKLIATIDALFGEKDWQSKVLMSEDVTDELDKFYHEDYEIEEKFDISLDEEE
jgi:hypothetical protein